MKLHRLTGDQITSKELIEHNGERSEMETTKNTLEAENSDERNKRGENLPAKPAWPVSSTVVLVAAKPA